MKFVVDEMPYYPEDCPFYSSSQCALQHDQCPYLYPWLKNPDEREECPWLKVPGAVQK